MSTLTLLRSIRSYSRFTTVSVHSHLFALVFSPFLDTSMMTFLVRSTRWQISKKSTYTSSRYAFTYGFHRVPRSHILWHWMNNRCRMLLDMTYELIMKVQTSAEFLRSDGQLQLRKKHFQRLLSSSWLACLKIYIETFISFPNAPKLVPEITLTTLLMISGLSTNFWNVFGDMTLGVAPLPWTTWSDWPLLWMVNNARYSFNHRCSRYPSQPSRIAAVFLYQE